jgi:NAD(P)-dependent dehydrogenase (short-subunit alcohol dehydrogenase family)
MTARFKDKAVVITGAAQGIGRAAALRCASEGARIVAVDLPGSDLAGLLAEIKKAGGQAIAVEADVTRRADVERYVAKAESEFGGVDCFFNNAGILGVNQPFLEYPEEMFDKVFAVNVKAVWTGIRLVAPAIIRRGGGAIVNTASIAGLKATAGLVAYTASKHAVVAMTKTASIELVKQGVRVNAVCPGPIETPMGEQLDRGLDPQNPAAGHERSVARIPMGRYGRSEEVAAVVAFLCSADAAFVNGGLYTIDGGAMA